MEKTYERKISSEEAREGYIMILKNRLSFFPPLRKSFVLLAENQKKEARIESYSCRCQGPDFPHEHYFVRWDGLKRGDSLVISKNENEYSMDVHHHQ